ncbi:ABC transporter substrate-binding protein [Pseudonocardia ailaonensis]|uniref:ABC transporter substrate-binding protein n=1 Tax=Pseudonocardia ailaonensis TaxID=367279 RepID=UPI0031D91395
MKRRQRFGLLAAALLTATLAACGGGGAAPAGTLASGGWEAIVDAAGTEGSLLVYSSATPAQIQRITQAFGRAHPDIAVEIATLTSSEQVTRLQQERDAGLAQADIAWNAQYNWFTQEQQAGHLADPRGPAAADNPPALKLTDSSRLLYALPIPLQWNKNAVTTPLTGYQDLLRPEFAGSLGLADITGGASLAGFYDWLQRTQGPDFLTRLAAQKPKFYIQPSESAQAVASAETKASGYGSLPASKALVAQGAPIELRLPEPAFSTTTYGAILDNAPHPNAAQVFFDWLQSTDGQKAIVGNGDVASPKDVDGGVAKIGSLTLYRGELGKDDVARITAEFNKAFGR